MLGDEEIHSNIVTVLSLVDQGVDSCRLLLEEFQVFAVEEGGSNEHHGVLVAIPETRGLQLKASVTVDSGGSRDVFSRYKSYNLIRKLLKRGGKGTVKCGVSLEQTWAKTLTYY